VADNNQRKNIPPNSKTELRDVYLDVAKQPTKAPFFLFGRLVLIILYKRIKPINY